MPIDAVAEYEALVSNSKLDELLSAAHAQAVKLGSTGAETPTITTLNKQADVVDSMATKVRAKIAAELKNKEQTRGQKVAAVLHMVKVASTLLGA